MNIETKENLYNFGKWYKISLYVAIVIFLVDIAFPIIVSARKIVSYFVMFPLYLSGGSAVFIFILSVASLGLGVLRSIMLFHLRKAKESATNKWLSITYYFQLVVVCALIYDSIMGILFVLEDERILNIGYFLYTLSLYIETKLPWIILLDLIGWCLFKAYFKQLKSKNPSDSLKQIQKCTTVFVITLGVGILWKTFGSWALQEYSVWTTYFNGTISVGITLIFVLLPILIIIGTVGLIYQFKIADGVLKEFNPGIR